MGMRPRSGFLNEVYSARRLFPVVYNYRRLTVINFTFPCVSTITAMYEYESRHPKEDLVLICLLV